jgi:hypothetical protein
MRIIAVVLAIGVWGGCANYATFQEADTIPDGQSRFGLGGTVTSYQAKDSEGNIDSVIVPATSLWYRRGVSERCELHVMAWIPLGSSGGFKCQVVGDRKTPGLSLALGLDLGFLLLTAGGDSVAILDTYVPLYLGYRVNPEFALYTSPKFILRAATAGSNSGLSALGGGTVGIAMGSGTTIYVEGSAMYDSDVDGTAIQGAFGVAF